MKQLQIRESVLNEGFQGRPTTIACKSTDLAANEEKHIFTNYSCYFIFSEFTLTLINYELRPSVNIGSQKFGAHILARSEFSDEDCKNFGV